jgi:hypothetical protein
LPIGLYLALAPGPLRWVLVCNAIYLLSAGIMAVSRSSRGRVTGAGGSGA